jgi:transposase-like protein
VLNYNIFMDTSIAAVEEPKIICPACDSDAAYRYGKIKTGAQRFMCMMCGTQFTQGAHKTIVKGKPLCPACGKHMNVYKLEGDVIRFRCSGYPQCKTFRKFTLKEEK